MSCTTLNRMSKRLSLTVLCALACWPGKTADAQLLYDLIAAPGSSYNNNPSQALTVGFDFQLSSAMKVTGLGVFNLFDQQLYENHEVGLWDSLGNLLASAVITPTDTKILSANGIDGWNVVNIAPVSLAPGTYTLGALFNDEVDLYKGNQPTTAQAGVTLGNDLVDPLSSPALTRPTSSTLAGGGWYGPNAILQPAAVPEGNSLVLLIAGAAPLVFVLRRRCQRKGSRSR